MSQKRMRCAQLDHVLVLNDGSPDATAERAKESGAEVITPRGEPRQGCRHQDRP